MKYCASETAEIHWPQYISYKYEDRGIWRESQAGLYSSASKALQLVVAFLAKTKKIGPTTCLPLFSK